MNIAIIPARKGSKRKPLKNRAKINGKSIFEIALEQALRVNIFESVYVTTDDEILLKEAEKYPFILDDREDNFCEDKTPLISVITHIIKKYNLSNDSIISLLTVTNPLRKDIDIIESNKLFAKKKRKRVISVSEVDYPIEMTWKINDNGELVNNHQIKTTRKQDFKSSYKWNDAIIIDTALGFLSNDKSLYGENSIPFIMPMERSFQIDCDWQFKIVKLMLENKFNQ